MTAESNASPPVDGAPIGQPLEPSVRRSLLTPTSIVILVAAVFAAVLLRDAFEVAHTTIGWVVACSVVAMLIDPLVGFVDRFLPRWLSVIAVLLAMVLVVAGLVIGLANDVMDSLDELRTTAPAAAAGLEEQFQWAADIGVEERVRTFVEELDDRVRSDALSAARETVPTYLVTGILMLFILGYGRRYISSFIDQFAERKRARMRQVVSGAARRSQRYLLTAAAHGVVNTVICWLVFNTIGVQAALSLSFVVGAFTVVPLVGVLIGGTPALLVAFGLDGWEDGGVVLVTLVALQIAEALLVRPRVDRGTLRLGSIVPIVAGLLGFELYGVGGAVYAVALAVIATAALDEIGDSEPVTPALPLETA
ncbi:MAG: AI-2E family transporter [Ilumatobacteraceae bacterium]